MSGYMWLSGRLLVANPYSPSLSSSTWLILDAMSTIQKDSAPLIISSPTPLPFTTTTTITHPGACVHKVRDLSHCQRFRSLLELWHHHSGTKLTQVTWCVVSGVSGEVLVVDVGSSGECCWCWLMGDTVSYKRSFLGMLVHPPLPTVPRCGIDATLKL